MYKKEKSVKLFLVLCLSSKGRYHLIVEQGQTVHRSKVINKKNTIRLKREAAKKGFSASGPTMKWGER